MNKENEINDSIKEYLNYCGFETTMKAFQDELNHHTLSEDEKSHKSPIHRKNIPELETTLFTFFKHGQREEFLAVWNEHVSEKIQREESTAQKLMFYLHIYFAIYPIQHEMSKEDKLNAMQQFREYLENQGAELSQTTEFLPFYALPFVPNPQSHPSFHELFEAHWVPNLEIRIRKFIESVLEANKHSQPKLIDLFSGDHHSLQPTQKDRDSSIQSQLVQAEKRAMQFLRRYNRLQSDYHNLIGITAELVDSLERSIQGHHIQPEFLQHICARLLSTQQRQQANRMSVDKSQNMINSISLSRPGTAGKLIRDSVMMKTSSIYQSTDVKNNDDITSWPDLDIEKINNDLRLGEIRTKLLLLQAIRWRLTKTPSNVQKNTLNKFLSKDIINCTENDVKHVMMFDLLKNIASPFVSQYFARFLNTMASFSKGRKYLAQNFSSVTILSNYLKSPVEQMELLFRENLIGSLQKLSLRRNMQTFMIKDGLIDVLLKILEDHDNLSDYTLEYSIALLMNLCLRSSGKFQCKENPNYILKVLTDLLGHDNQDILPYVNGALYSILAVPEIREAGKAMDLEGIIRCFIKEGQQDMNRQFEFIIKQLNSSDEPTQTESDDEEEEDEEEEIEALELDLDKDENVFIEKPDELSGEDLLKTNYSSSDVDSASFKQKPLTRPVTPSQRTALENHQNAQTMEPFFEADLDNFQESARPISNQSQNKQKKPESSTEKRKSQDAGGNTRASKEYQQVFSSKHKLPRTPNPAHKNSITSTSSEKKFESTATPQPTYSNRLPTPRPTSSGKTGY